MCSADVQRRCAAPVCSPLHEGRSDGEKANEIDGLWVALGEVMRAAVLVATLALAALLSLHAAPARAEAPSFDDPETQALGTLSAPAYASAGVVIGLELAVPSLERSRSFAIGELVSSGLVAAYTAFAYAGYQDEPAGLGASATAFAMSLHLELATRAALRLALGFPERSFATIPRVSVTPLEGGAMGSVRWAF
jgi:hypothetical protein